MENKIFQTPSTIMKISTTSDRGLRLVIDTQELSPEENSKLFLMDKKEGWLLFKPNNFQIEDIPKNNAKVHSKDLKTPGQRYRATLYVYWKQKINNGDFNKWYELFIEDQINKIKEQLT